MKIFLIFLYLLLSNLYLYTTIINIPADQPTIQQGIETSVNGDTVLVQPGTYLENVNYNGKNITVASLFLTTQDTIYISETIIDGNQNGSVVTFESEEDTTAVLSGFTIKNGFGNHGGGIYCYYSSSTLSNLIIHNNSAEHYGGGIYSWNSYFPIKIINVLVAENSANHGGGIYLKGNYNTVLQDLVIQNNHSYYRGGGLFLDGHNEILKNININNNVSLSSGGGIYCESNYIYLENIQIHNNNARIGGGIDFDNSTPTLIGVNIENNYADLFGGGISVYDSSLDFSNENKCNIYSNSIINNRGFGADIYALNCDQINVIVDTFTVFNPTDFYATPANNYYFDISFSVQDSLINSDLYVSVNGDDLNSGISDEEPLKTIYKALSKIYADSLNQNTIFLAPGIYSPNTNGEIMPISWSQL